jgi:hypothetical protein
VLYFESRELHSLDADHESPRRPTRSPSGIRTAGPPPRRLGSEQPAPVCGALEPVLAQSLLDAPGGGSCNALIDGKCLLQAGGGFTGVAVLQVAAAGAFQGACFLQGVPRSRVDRVASLECSRRKFADAARSSDIQALGSDLPGALVDPVADRANRCLRAPTSPAATSFPVPTALPALPGPTAAARPRTRPRAPCPERPRNGTPSGA